MAQDDDALGNIDIGVLGKTMLAAAHAAHIGVAMTLVNPLRHIYISEAAADILGWPAEELLRQPPLAHTPPGEMARMKDRLARRAGGELGQARYEVTVLRRDGKPVDVEVTATDVMIGGQQAVFTFVQDITARKRLETQLVQADRLAALGTMAAGAAHEINNPLAYIMLNLECILRKLPAAVQDASSIDSLMTMLEEAREGAERVSTIVRELRSFSRVDGETRRPIDLAEVVDAAIKITGHEIRHRARLVRSFEPVRPVWANEARLEQVVINLLLNAGHALPDARSETNEIRVILREDGKGRAVLEVSDNGEGMPADVQSRIFDPFFTTKPVGVGTGLGLSICHGIVTSLGGQICVDSEPGVGTTFRVVLPTTGLHKDESTTATSRPPSSNGPRAHVLVVDDEAPIANTMRELLGFEHEVVIATGGREALAVIRSGAHFDVIFCDLMMPGISGIDLYEQLRLQNPGLERKLVFMTGGAFTARAAEFLASVDNRRIEKPFSAGMLERIVHEMAAPSAAE